MKKSLYILTCIIFLFGCKKEAFVHPDYLVFGAIQGDCGNGCRFAYYLDDIRLAEDSTVKYYATKNLELFKKEIDNDKFLIAKGLINKIPVELTKTNKNIFIDLNASSPNLWYAEIKLNGNVYSWIFDNAASSTPAYLKPFADEMIRTTQLIR